MTKKDDSIIFVVHGRNEAIRADLFSFLRSIGLKPLEWSEAIQKTGKTAPYIGDILDTAFSEAKAIVVLMTPDDVAKLRTEFQQKHDAPYEKNLTPQARPNVLFEAGMAMGRSPDQTIIVQVGEIRPFSDIAGRHVINLNNSVSRRQELAQRLEMAGCPINLAGTDWHRTGNFEIKLLPSDAEDTTASALNLALPDQEVYKADLRLLNLLWPRINTDYMYSLGQQEQAGWVYATLWEEHIVEYMRLRSKHENHFYNSALEDAFQQFDIPLRQYLSEHSRVYGAITTGEDFDIYVLPFREERQPDDYSIVEEQKKAHKEFLNKFSEVMQRHRDIIEAIRNNIPGFEFPSDGNQYGWDV